MKLILSLILILAYLSFGAKGEVKVEKYNDNLYKISKIRGKYSVNMVLFKGVDGVLLVDTGEKEWSDEMKKTVLDIGGEIPKYIINTHAHSDHTGGNLAFGDQPVKIAHQKCRERFTKGYMSWEEYPESFLPTITFTDSMKLHFNGEEIRLISTTGAQDSNDIIVWFKDQKIVALGDLSFGMEFPTVDPNGSAFKYSPIYQRLLNLLPKDIVAISGHGKDINYSDMIKYQSMFSESCKIVEDLHKSGMSKDDIIRLDPLKDWIEYEGYLTRDSWIEYIVTTIEYRELMSRKDIHIPFYNEYKKSGAKAAVDLYKDLFINHRDDYQIDDADLFSVGNILDNRGKKDEAILFYNQSIELFPEGRFITYSYFYLGKIYMGMDRDEKAIASFKKVLDIDPSLTVAQKKIDEIMGN
jgi:glyoxylase-like metal-dependent hydrolase (beta-lactamase superfamily II)